jgi:hypothetical protein
MTPRGRRPTVVTALAVAAMVVGATACSTSKPFRPLASGQCLPRSAEVVGRREQQPPIVACDQPHRYEVYATPTVDLGDEWPGQSASDEASKQLCYDQFRTGTGHDPLTIPDDVRVLTIGPSGSSFAKGDRRVECLVVLPHDPATRFIHPTSTAQT